MTDSEIDLKNYLFGRFLSERGWTDKYCWRIVEKKYYELKKSNPTKSMPRLLDELKNGKHLYLFEG